MIESRKLTDIELYSENGQYFLKAEYEEVTKTQKKRITIPKIILPLSDYPIIDVTTYTLRSLPDVTVNIGFGKLDIQGVLNQDSSDRVYYTEEILEEYPQKMTLEEIEKKLGYKVEIVSKKE